jgi:hypothetical protein
MSSHLNNTGRDGPNSVYEAPSNDEEVESFYLQKLRNVYFANTHNSDGLIMNDQEWEVLISMFLSNRLISIEDEKKLQAVKPSFPMEFDTFVSTVA